MQLAKYQMVNVQGWKGLTKDNHLGMIYNLEPQRATNLWVRLLANNYGPTLDTYLRRFPKKSFQDDSEYYWNIIGSSRRNIPIIEARDLDGTVITAGMAGAGTAPFYVVFAEDWWADGNVIVGEKNELYMLRILGEPRMEGTRAVYKVELMGGNTKGMPAEELAAGKRFSVEYSPVEKGLSHKVGDIRFSSPIAMRNEWSTIRIQHKVPGNMLNKKVAVGIPYEDQNGNVKVANMWMHHVEYQLEVQFSEEKNNLIMFGRSNRNANGEYMNFGKSGEVIRMGAGLREQMEVGNTIYYTRFSLKLVEKALLELSAGKLKMKNRIFVLKTGEWGAIQFHNAVVNDVERRWGAFIINADQLGMVKRVTSELNANSLSAGYQFTEYRAPNNVVVKVEIDPLYDDPVRNKLMHPDGGVGESYRYDILYIGDMDQPNIQLATIDGDTEYRGYEWGMRNPYTGAKFNPNMSFSEDAAVIHRMWTGGVFILDATRTMSLIPDILS